MISETKQLGAQNHFLGKFCPLAEENPYDANGIGSLMMGITTNFSEIKMKLRQCGSQKCLRGDKDDAYRFFPLPQNFNHSPD